MSLHQAKQLREARARNAELIKANLAEIAKAETTEARRKELLAANETAFAKIDEDKRTIDQIERQADLDSELDSRGRGRHNARPELSADPKERKEQVRCAVETFMRLGYEGLTDEGRLILPQVDNSKMSDQIQSAVRSMRGMMKEARDLATTTSGVVIPREYWDTLSENMLEFGGMREVATVVPTGTGGQLTFPTDDDTGNQADQVSEAAQTTTSVDATLSSMTLDAYTYRSFCLVSREFIQDWQFDVDSWVRRKLATRLARRLNQRFTTGTGSSQPNGVMTAVTSSGTMGSGTAVTITDLTALEHSVDPAYRRNARWMFHDNMLRNLKRMVDTNGQPLWHLGIDGRNPDTIYGYPFTVNQDVAQPTSAGSKVIAFGDFSKYIVRDVVNGDAGPVILRLNERYADYGQVGFFLFSRHDGDLIDAGTDPIRCLVTGSPQS